ncbi:MAG: hypothetical protein OXI35_16455, partial [Gemmatimonadota bacterium]|nr:hypothetical protein [Gemmatimonadota bacterium]
RARPPCGRTGRRTGPAGTDPARFAAVYEQILEITQDKLGCPLVLLTPFYISTDHNGQTFRSQVLELLPRYIKVVEQLAERFDARLVRLHDIFQRQLQYRDADTFCPEPVHPNQAGHLVIAQALMDTLSA